MGITSPTLEGEGQGAKAQESRGWEVGEERAGKGGKWEKKGLEVEVRRRQESFIKH